MAKRLTVGDVGKVVSTGGVDYLHAFDEGQVVKITQDHRDFQPYLCVDAKTEEEVMNGWLFEDQIVAIEKVESEGESALTKATLTHKGKTLRKVDRKAQAGDFVAFNRDLTLMFSGGNTTGGKLYEVLEGAEYIDNDGNELMVYGWNVTDPHPNVYEVVEESSEETDEKTRLQVGEKFEVISLSVAMLGFSVGDIVTIANDTNDPTDPLPYLVEHANGYTGWAGAEHLRKLDEATTTPKTKEGDGMGGIEIGGKYTLRNAYGPLAGFDAGNEVEVVSARHNGTEMRFTVSKGGAVGYTNAENLIPVVKKEEIEIGDTVEIVASMYSLLRIAIGETAKVVRPAFLGFVVATEDGREEGMLMTQMRKVVTPPTPKPAKIKVGDRVLIGKTPYTLADNHHRGTVLRTDAPYRGKIEVGIDTYRIPLTFHEEELTVIGEVQRAPKSFSEGLPSVKSMNQLRAEAIQAAKDFVIETQERAVGHSINDEGSFDFRHRTTVSEFVVNAEKRTVVALIKGANYRAQYGKGIAKCHPDDVFNADIGRAIALARAYDLELPKELRRIPEPTEIVVGQKFDTAPGGAYWQGVVTGIISDQTRLHNPRNHTGTTFNHSHDSGWLAQSQVKIIDDSDAKYEGGK